MRFLKRLLLLGTHAAMLAVGFGLGVYFLPIMVADAPPDASQLTAVREQAQFQGRFARDLPGSDFLHWAEGEVFVAAERVSFEGDMAPGPDYKLYLVPSFVTNEAEFMALKPRAARIGSIKSFQAFALTVPEGVDVAAYDSAVIWCERFREFISAARYR